MANDEERITFAQAQYLGQLCRWNGIRKAEICKLAGARYYNRISKSRASELIDQLKNNDGELKRKLAEIRGQLPMFTTE